MPFPVIRVLRFFAISAFLGTLGFPQNIQFHTLDEGTIERRLQVAPKTNELREAGIEQLFAEAGCASKDITKQPVNKRKFFNVICTLSGDTDRTILVTAHYDKVAEGQGVVDNWTGVALLPDIYQSLQGLPHKHRIIFISFCCEEEGLVGSQAFVEGLTKEEAAKIAAVINIDSLGLSPTKLWVSRADKHLSAILLAAAQTMNLPLSGMDVEKVGSADSESFEKLKIPRMTLHSVTQDTLKVLHSPLDQFKSVHMQEYYDSYKLIAAFVSLADSTLDVAPAPASKPQ
jgi:putative aminopeptidase FrvX